MFIISRYGLVNLRKKYKLGDYLGELVNSW